jgi:hypothetical protein
LEVQFYQGAHRVKDGSMNFLHTWSGRFRDIHVDVCVQAHAATVSSGQRHRDHATSFRHGQADLDILGSAARGNPESDVTPPAESLDLSREDLRVAVIIGDRGHDAGIARQSDGGERSPLTLESPHELGDEMLGVGGTPTVSEYQHLSTFAERTAEYARGRCDALESLDRKSVMSSRRFIEDRAKHHH